MAGPYRQPASNDVLDGNVARATKEYPIDATVQVQDQIFPSVAPETLEVGRELALAIADAISETPAANTLVLDVHAVSPLADFFVICSGENERQLRAISREVGEQLATAGIRPKRSEGTAEGGWILLDYGDVVVHIFHEDQRTFYRLEDLWSEAHTLLSIQ
ncbi:MAG: ribosome silencing factor [Chloroflexota bacterium]|nr:ribosome silencing factor [Chloroflexota bacterium]